MTEWWVVAMLSVGLFVAATGVLGRAWVMRADAGEHGIIVAVTFLIVTFGLVLTSAGQALDDERVMAPGSALIRGALLVCLVYLFRRYR